MSSVSGSGSIGLALMLVGKYSSSGVPEPDGEWLYWDGEKYVLLRYQHCDYEKEW